MTHLIQWHERIVGNFPKVPIGIGEIPGVSAPENFVRGFHEPSTRRDGFGNHSVDFGFAFNIVSERDAGESRFAVFNLSIISERGAAIQTEHNATRIKEGYTFLAGP